MPCAQKHSPVCKKLWSTAERINKPKEKWNHKSELVAPEEHPYGPCEPTGGSLHRGEGFLEAPLRGCGGILVGANR